MKGAPGFKKWGDPVDRGWKQDFLYWLGDEAGINTVFETGTHTGGMACALANHFEHVYTIELSYPLFEGAKKILAIRNNVTQYFGSSRIRMAEILKSIPNKPTLFWLDAHYSGGDTAYDGEALPGELRAVMELRPDALIAIDDMPGVEIDADNLEIKALPWEGWYKEYRTGIILMYRQDRYNIPPFEDSK